MKRVEVRGPYRPPHLDTLVRISPKFEYSQMKLSKDSFFLPSGALDLNYKT